MRSQDKVGRQKSPRLRVPVHAAASDTVRRHEGAPLPNWKRRLVHLVAECEGRLCWPKEQVVADVIAQLVLHVVRWKVGRRVAPRTAFYRDHVETGVGQFMCQN